MAKLIYLDTNIYLDYWGDRSDHLRPLGEYAFNILKSAIDCNFIILVSNLVLQELRKRLSRDSIELLFKNLYDANKIELIEFLPEEKKKACELKNQFNTSHSDMLHAIIAKRGGAKYLVTRNLKDFEQLGAFIEAILPEELS